MTFADISRLTAQLDGVAERRRATMIVADLENGNGDAVEDAVIAAWELQSPG